MPPIFKQLGIGIVSFRRPEKLKALVESIEESTRRPYRLYIYDNFSDQKTIAVLKGLERAGRATVIYGPTNAGPYRAYNELFKIFDEKRGDIPYFAKIDDDCVITRKNWDDVMLKPFFEHPDKENVVFVTCKLGNPGNFPADDQGVIRQCATEFFVMRSGAVNLIGPVIERGIHGYEFNYSMDSEWTERIGCYGFKIVQVENIYAAPSCGTTKRPEYFPGERAALKQQIGGSVKRWGQMDAARKKFMES